MTCAPEETHEIACLMMSVLLRHSGYRVEYLGPDLPIEDLIDYARQEKPAMLCISATVEENALRLTHVQEKLSRVRPKPLFGYGGQAFMLKPDLKNKVPGEYLGDSIAEGVIRVEHLLG